jgi:hypothetical protein
LKLENDAPIETQITEKFDTKIIGQVIVNRVRKLFKRFMQNAPPQYFDSILMEINF